MTIRSDKFDDIYFSAQDGLAETTYVFLDHNNLPQAWAGKNRFVIAETGFGTGLNFLATWEAFRQTASPLQSLHYISVEKYPLSWNRIQQALSPWASRLQTLMRELKKQYPLRIPGFHTLYLPDQVTLTLIFDDVNQAMSQISAPEGIDAWFLDGFAPAKNPEMWTETVFNEMARLSHAKTTVSTFTAAGAVRRGLQKAGFTISKVPGFGKKREMLTGRYNGVPASDDIQKTHLSQGARVAIVGGGLSGTAAAFALKHQGLTPVIYEAADHLAAGASGNDIGLINPRLSKLRTVKADFYMSAWALALRTFARIQSKIDIGFNPTGSLHLATADDKTERYEATIKNWGWPDEVMMWLSPAQAAKKAGCSAIKQEALYLPDAAIVSPLKLCRAYADGVETHLSTPVTSLRQTDKGHWRVNSDVFDAVILACGLSAADFAEADWLPLNHVRGQLTTITTTPTLSTLSLALSYGGYCTPALNGHHYIGATFQPWLDDPLPRAEDDQDNLAKLRDVMPMKETPDIIDHRVGFRTSSKDRFPVIGACPDIKRWIAGSEDNLQGLYLSTGHGSHGLIASIAAARIIAHDLVGSPAPLAHPVLEALSPHRFLARRKRRGQL